MKIAISQPMKGKTKEEIMEERKKVIEIAKIKKDELIGKIFEGYEDEGNMAIKSLAKSIEAIAAADVVVFFKGYAETRGCNLEYAICMEYGKKIIFEEDYCASPKGKENIFIGKKRAEENWKNERNNFIKLICIIFSLGLIFGLIFGWLFKYM